MNGALIALDTWAGRDAAALMLDGRLEDVMIAPPQDVPVLGTVFVGVAERPLKGTGGQFVRLPGGLKGFLKGNAPQGRRLAVQVNGFAEPGKAIPITTRLVLKSAAAIITPGAPSRSVARSIKGKAGDELKSFAARLDLPEGVGVIIRSAALVATPEQITKQVAALVEDLSKIDPLPDKPTLLVPGRTPRTWSETEWSPDAIIDPNPNSFDRHAVRDALEAVLTGETALPSGGSVVIEATRALVAVDVNSGGAHGGAQGLTATLEALADLPRLLRLRGLGGQITIDCAPFGKAHRRTVEQRIAKAFGTDSVESNFAGWTPLGHIELTRKRERFPTPHEG
ncbi:MAG: ribonuclease E/G [Pseudomonadota bacterium]